MDYGRFKFEALKREKESRKEHSVVHVKEMKLRPKISEHDFQTKFGYVRQFLKGGNKVKVTITFRGREMVHQEFGRRLLDRMAEGLKEVAAIERSPLVEGRNMIMIMSPAGKKGPKPENGSAPSPAAAKPAPAAPPQAVATEATPETAPAPTVAKEPAAPKAEAAPAAEKPKTTRAKTTTTAKPKSVAAKPATKRTTTKGATSNAKDQKS